MPTRKKQSDPLRECLPMLRALAANFRLGQPENARALANFAARADAAGAGGVYAGIA